VEAVPPIKPKGPTKYYYNGVPKTLLKKQQETAVDKDKLNYAKAKWLTKRGVNVMSVDKDSEQESRKLFRYIDFDNDGVIGRRHIRLFLAFMEGEYAKSGALEQNPVYKQLKRIGQQAGEIKIGEEHFA
jgi:Ca2+-binding EF-hand superfamily protein